MAKKAAAKRKPGRPKLTEEQKAERRKIGREKKAERARSIKAFAAKARKSASLRQASADATVASKKIDEVKTGGDPKFVPTEEQMAQVEMSAGLGLRLDEIAALITNPNTGEGVGIKTLKRAFPQELVRGPARTHANVAQSIYARAIDMNHPQGGTMAIWFSKTQMGWHDRTIVEVEVKTGVLVPPPKMSPQEWIEQASIRTIDAEEPGIEGNNERAEE